MSESTVLSLKEIKEMELPPLIEGALIVDRASTKYQIEFDPKSAVKFLSLAEAYNNFSREDLVRLLFRLDMKLPKQFYNEGNPNNGKPIYSLLIGNEGSRVIYVRASKFCGIGKELDWQDVADRLTVFAKEANANEYWIEENNNIEFLYRIWFD